MSVRCSGCTSLLFTNITDRNEQNVKSTSITLGTKRRRNSLKNVPNRGGGQERSIFNHAINVGLWHGSKVGNG